MKKYFVTGTYVTFYFTDLFFFETGKWMINVLQNNE